MSRQFLLPWIRTRLRGNGMMLAKMFKQLNLLSRSAEHYENSKLERSWIGESMKPSYTINPRSFNDCYIDVSVIGDENSTEWWLTGFYGVSNGRRRADSWALLKQFNQNYHNPSVVMGDFNEILLI
ncbi:hypothetical protein J1N35_028092 [Gossypium stocksii]|uniref:Endonuclease/exonuclease/phosphatase domain-containing protein n=1 Tax=Gossypium stocksii TaxID=47602 RepID=A0A9D3UVE5_9ROSI|nr:hypothetical protein J1N35_028092 [Gossypium stocksii]